jgi:hypothetical protein
MNDKLENEVAVLRAKVEYLEALTASLMRILWDQRGRFNSIGGRIEKELDPFWKNYLEREKG